MVSVCRFDSRKLKEFLPGGSSFLRELEKEAFCSEKGRICLYLSVYAQMLLSRRVHFLLFSLFSPLSFPLSQSRSPPLPLPLFLCLAVTLFYFCGCQPYGYTLRVMTGLLLTVKAECLGSILSPMLYPLLGWEW